MKKTMTLLITMILLVSILPLVFAQSIEDNGENNPTTTSEIPIYTPSSICGDVNGDGVVSILDVDIIPRVSAGLARWGERADLTRADANGNGRVDLTDSGRIARMATGEIRGLCPGMNENTNLNENIKNPNTKPVENSNTKNEITFKRNLNDEKIKIANQNFINARENFIKVNNKYTNLKKDFAEVKVEVKQICGSEPNSEKCTEMNSKSFEIGRDLLLKGTESAIEHLKQIIAKIEASEDVSSEDAKQRLNELNMYVTSLVSLKDMVEKAQTKEELKEAATKLETLWGLIKFDSKVQTLKLMSDKLEGIYNRAKAVEAKLKCSLVSVSDEKKKEILNKLDNYDNLLESARKKHKEGIALLNNAVADKNLEQIEESKNLMLESYNIIRKTQGLVISIFNEIRNAGGKLNACNDS